MKQKKNIIICWNDNAYQGVLNDSFLNAENYNVKVFTSFDYFSQLGETDTEIKKALKDCSGFVVLCELQWNHEKTNSPYLEFQGITFVQRYLRDRLGLKVPVVFTSFLDAKDIISPELKPQLRPDAGIIMTPALQHRFVRLPAKLEELLKPFGKMRKMSDTELVYTQMQYCNHKGFLSQIKHNVEGRSASDQDYYRKQIKFVLEKDNRFKGFSDYIKLLQECKTTQDLSSFCAKLINRLTDSKETTSSSNNIDFHFACKSETEQIKILLLEDNPDDPHVHQFVEFITEKNRCYNEQNMTFVFRIPIIAKSEEEFKRLFKRTRYEVVICDIEIRGEEGNLDALGFNIIESLIGEGYTRPLYYIVTNVTRSFYDQIKIQRINRIRLKEEVFGSEREMERLIYGIKEVMEHQKQVADDPYKYLKVYNELDNYINNPRNYPIEFKNTTKFGVQTFLSFDSLNERVHFEALKLIKEFLCIMNAHLCQCEVIGKRFSIKKEFDSVCREMRQSIKNGITCANEKFVKDFDLGSDIQPNHIEKFIIRMILRRFFLYLRVFIAHYGLVNNYPDELRLTVNDIACRAINKQYKGVDEIQSKCLIYTLLYSPEKSDDLQQTIEEKAFVEAVVDKGEKAFPYTDEDEIEELNF
ncbi:MAG: hypothetical protein IKZ55_08655 [Bacteroidales bacterium]|nr:hypothetical protein [Bacteroidales bacterium]